MTRSQRCAADDLLEQPIFFDTNVLVYCYEPLDAARRERALDVVAEAMRADRFVLSTQVMQEFYSVVLRRRLLAPSDALASLQLLAEHTVVPADAGSVLRAFALHQRCGLSVWDALIVQAALDSGCAALFTEDLQDGQRFASADDPNRTVTVINPFARGSAASPPAVHEPRRRYAATRRSVAPSRRRP